MPTEGFDIVAEDPQVKHVAGQMQNASMQEHGSNDRVQILSVDQQIGNCGVILDEGS